MTRNFRKLPALAAFIAPLILALAAAIWGYGQRADSEAGAVEESPLFTRLPASTQLEQIAIRDARELNRLFAELAYVWPPAPGPTIPRIAIDTLPDDFAWPADNQHKKDMFFKVLMPLALAENARVLRQRDGLKAALAAIRNPDIAADHPAWRLLEDLAKVYQVEGALDDPATHHALLERVDGLPVELVLAQAANESGWGESRFAREGNNLFGVWTYQAEHGMVPADRPEGETYAVRRYSTLRASVRSHLFNLNIGHAYKNLREMRAEMRERGEGLDALKLAAGLERYSIRGQDYINEIRAIIRTNDLTRVALAELRVAPAAPVYTAALQFSPGPVNLLIAATTAD